MVQLSALERIELNAALYTCLNLREHAAILSEVQIVLWLTRI